MIKSIEEQIFIQASLNPEKVALIDAINDFTLSYYELTEHIARGVEWIKSQHIPKGSRIILAASKNPGFVIAYFAVHISGLIAVPLDPETNEERLRRICKSASPILVIGDLRNALLINNLQIISFDELLNAQPAASISFPILSDTADILFTTGTTGLPKGVALSFLNEASAARNINQQIGNSEEDVELLALPASHSFGLGRIRCMLSIGATIVLLGSFASMKKFFGALDKYPVTGFGMVPASWAYISKMSGERISKFANQLKYIEIGSAAMPIEEKHHLKRLLPDTNIWMHYGLTEASRSAFLSFDDKEHLSTAGKSAPNVEIAIFSAEGVKLSAGQEGELCVQGDHVCSKYWNLPEEDFKKDFFGKWFRTGDIGSLSDDGYLSLVGRSKEIINVGGKKVNPQEVEDILISYPGVKDCACVGMPDPVLGEVVRGCIVSNEKLDLDALKTFTASRVENYKVPIKFDFVEKIPRTSSGKIQRLKLK